MGTILWYILIGFVAGTLAKLIIPGERAEPRGCLMTILLGIAGSVLVGLLLRLVPGWEGNGGLVPTLIGATIGAILLIVLFRKVWAGGTTETTRTTDRRL